MRAHRYPVGYPLGASGIFHLITVCLENIDFAQRFVDAAHIPEALSKAMFQHLELRFGQQGRMAVLRAQPLDLDVIQLTAQFVARNGPEFETRIKNEQNNAKFSFLQPNDPFHPYYRAKVVELCPGVQVHGASCFACIFAHAKQLKADEDF